MKKLLSLLVLAVITVSLSSCAPNIVVPNEPAIGCEHIPLDNVLPGIGSELPRISSRNEQYRNDKQLVPGQKVADFTLTSLDGEAVSLSDVLRQNDIVLIDFWASWCGPCIASFPKFKELRDTYGPEGFEIVAISIDREREDWEDSSAEHEIPWLNLGELESWHGEVAIKYGVHFVPKSYLVDSNGCILQKDLPTTSLEEVLSSQYSKDPDMDSSVETDTEENST
ncbi:MAG: TlpA family protein disulfide reductase [Gammaproteobacteria bacterium]|nr:TlpA family protein disulfide reductase [Gammaproteobacteria bacterium]MYC24409.1 TlpA family protein disulfide reductase [Gammaproteobacteria bacterium]